VFSTGELILQQLVNGLVSGSFYALVALGYSMVYGIVKLLNFAHGDIYMTGAFGFLATFGVLASVLPGWPGVLCAVLAAMCLAAALGFLAQRFAYRPLLGAPRLSLLITAIGVSLVIYNAVMLISQSQPSYFTDVLGSGVVDDIPANAAVRQIIDNGIQIGSMTVTYMKLVLLAVSALLMIGLTLYIGRTMSGRAMRAIAMDQDTCRLMGINVRKIIGLTFVIGSALAAVAGGLYCLCYGNIKYDMGFSIGIKAFTSAVIGGIGSIPGAMLGGLLLGLLESIGTQNLGSQWKDVFAFGLLILILILRPNGLLGKSEVERM